MIYKTITNGNTVCFWIADNPQEVARKARALPHFASSRILLANPNSFPAEVLAVKESGKDNFVWSK